MGWSLFCDLNKQNTSRIYILQVLFRWESVFLWVFTLLIIISFLCILLNYFLDQWTFQEIMNCKKRIKLHQAVCHQPLWCQNPPLRLLKHSCFIPSCSQFLVVLLIVLSRPSRQIYSVRMVGSSSQKNSFCSTWDPLLAQGASHKKIPHTGDTNSLDRCGQQDRYKFEEVA